MSLRGACLVLGLLLSVHRSGATLSVRVPGFPIQARPGSDARLPCHITSVSVPLSLSRLGVVWRVDSQIIAKYEDRKFEPKRPGVMMDSEQLVTGDATLQIQHVQDTDTAVYTCSVIYVPDSDSGKVDLRVEVPPNVTLGPTTVQLGKQSGVKCSASGFYPGNISVTWFLNNVTVKGPESPTVQRDPNGLFNAESVLELIPRIEDADSTIACHINHKALAQPLTESSQLKIQAPPTIQVLPQPTGTKFSAAECLVSGFYPQEIQIQWLKDGVPQRKIASRPERMPDGTFSAVSVILMQEKDAEATCVCQVQHEALDGPLENKILWQPPGEGVGVICPTPPSCQVSGSQQNSQLSCRTPTLPSSTASSVPGTFRLEDHWWLVLIGTILGLPIGVAVTICCSKHRAKNKKKIDASLPGTEKANDHSFSLLKY
ncbi:hypothetical protein JRQ81_005676 [Phrynocephalus forsythii]|uniref:Ig-like domain-containing protein n=1 Tax=Phrynocephalus forsythii TaxID=171643 RepID=A0A9Q0XHB3_9SAUR|nr:hypothetical protein JRQ81_005676 [Phrynocephalus forsythii]